MSASASANNRPDTPSRSAAQLRNDIGSPTSTGSEAGYDSPSFVEAYPSGSLAHKLGRSLVGAAVGSSLSLAGSGYNSPSLALTGFNAISTVLNHPSKRQHPIDPKSSRFPPLTPTPHVLSDIPRAKKADLEGYLSSVRPEWDRFMRNQKLGRQGKARVADGQQDGAEEQAAQGELRIEAEASAKGRGTRPHHRSRGSVTSLSADLRAQPTPAPRKRLPPLSSVPQVFFSEDFDLGDPYTFDLVTERYKATTANAGQDGAAAHSYDVALNQMLQEKLSYYSDVIEQHLILEIGQQSSSFFAALGNLNELSAEAESCLEQIDHLKAELAQIDEQQAKQGLRVVLEQDRRRQLHRKRKAVESVREVIERRDLANLLVQQGETEEALEVIDGLRAALSAPPSTGANAAGEQPPLRLADLQSLQFLLPQLEELESSLSGSLQRDLVAILAESLSSRIGATDGEGEAGRTQEQGYFSDQLRSAPPTGDPLSPASPLRGGAPGPSAAKVPSSPFGSASKPLSSSDAQLRARIAPLLGGLVRTGGIDGLAAAYREAAMQAVKAMWRSRVGEGDTSMAQLAAYLETEDPSKGDLDSAPEFVARFRDADHETFLPLGRRLFDALLRCLKGVDSQAKLVIRILDEYHASSSGGGGGDAAETSGRHDAAPIMPAGVSPSLPATMADIVTACTELSHVLAARLIAIRSGTHTSMDLAPFLAVFQLCWSYVLSSELVCRKMIVGLRGAVLSQAKGFLSHFHRKRIEKAAKAVEEETWAQSDVGPDVQRQVRLIVESAVEDPAAFVVFGDAGRASIDAPSADSEDGAGPSKALEIEDRAYFVVSASLDVLKLLADYLRVIINLPLLTTEAMGRVVEFLKQFNSRTCQVVLGAGAMRSAGLKNITAKHLALASQSLSIMISLVPYIRETVRRHLSPKQAVMLTEFDKLRRDFQEHQYEIHAKLVAIMSDRLTVHCRALGNVEWNAALPDNDEAAPEANKYAADLVKETATLHKVLTKYLQPPVVEHVIGQVLKAIDVRVAAEMDKVDVQTQAARRRFEADIALLETRLSALKHVEWKGENLAAILENKRVPAPPPPSEAGKGAPAETSEPQPQPPVQQHAYKPRIPSIFTRRQQQQQQQQGSPARSPGASSPSSATLQARPSHESMPRSSLQEISVPPVPVKDTEGAAVSADNGGGANAVDDHDGPPPTPPAKTAAAADSQDQVPSTPVEPSQQPPAVQPEAESAKPEPSSAMLESEPATSSPSVDAASTSEGKRESPASQHRRSHEAEMRPDATPTSKRGSTEQTEPKREAKDETAASESKPPASADAAAETGEAEAAAASVASASQTTAPAAASLSATGSAPDLTSPIKSGASTPNSASGTPSKPGRMSLKERLAEAARKRMMAQQITAPLASKPTSQTPPVPEVAMAAAPEPSSTEPAAANGEATAATSAPTAHTETPAETPVGAQKQAEPVTTAPAEVRTEIAEVTASPTRPLEASKADPADASKADGAEAGEADVAAGTESQAAMIAQVSGAGSAATDPADERKEAMVGVEAEPTNVPTDPRQSSERAEDTPSNPDANRSGADVPAQTDATDESEPAAAATDKGEAGGSAKADTKAEAEATNNAIEAAKVAPSDADEARDDTIAASKPVTLRADANADDDDDAVGAASSVAAVSWDEAREEGEAGTTSTPIASGTATPELGGDDGDNDGEGEDDDSAKAETVDETTGKSPNGTDVPGTKASGGGGGKKKKKKNKKKK
ncbi:hypothetical protein ACQY0O_001810 [Thecaphora frezii]